MSEDESHLDLHLSCITEEMLMFGLVNRCHIRHAYIRELREHLHPILVVMSESSMDKAQILQMYQYR